MSRRRKRPLPRLAQPQPRRGARLIWLVLLTLLIGAGTAFWLWLWLTTSPLPIISTAQLDASSSTLIQQHTNAVRKAPRSGAAWGRLGGVLRSYEFREEARYCLETAQRFDPKEPRWPYLQGLLLVHTAPEEAMAGLRRAVELCGNEPEAPRLRLARLLAEQGQWADAQRELRELLRAKPENPSALLTLALVAQARGELTNAVALAGRCTTHAYTARAAWTLLGSLHQRLGDTNAAWFASRKAATVAPDVPAPDPFEAEFRQLRTDARSLSDQAQQFLLARRTADAAPLIERLVENYPQFAETWLLRGRLQYLDKRPVQAEQSLRRHLELDPQSLNGHFQLGMSLLAQQRYLEAAAAFETAIQLKADFGPAFFNLGFARAKAGQKQAAVQPFREAMRHNPEYLDSYILLADLYLQIGQKRDAIELERQARALRPDDPRLPVLRERLDRQ
jgi:tetratricopeptide (TPR) repeat protein